MAEEVVGFDIPKIGSYVGGSYDNQKLLQPTKTAFQMRLYHRKQREAELQIQKWQLKAEEHRERRKHTYGWIWLSIDLQRRKYISICLCDS